MKGATVVAIIGGSGVDGIAGFVERDRVAPVTPWGDTSACVHRGTLRGVDALYLARHGEPHSIAPHRVNYRANLWALRELGATHVLALNAVGGIAAIAAPGELFLPHQIIDYTWGREGSYHDGTQLPLRHQEFAEPYTPAFRASVAAAARAAGVTVHGRAVYGCTQGPRLETAAEIERMARDGCDLVGMTGMPEAALAAELGLDYASLAMVVNHAAGKSPEPITEADILRAARACADRVAAVLDALAAELAAR